jgi:hypothetical protein
MINNPPPASSDDPQPPINLKDYVRNALENRTKSRFGIIATLIDDYRLSREDCQSGVG